MLIHKIKSCKSTDFFIILWYNNET